MIEMSIENLTKKVVKELQQEGVFPYFEIAKINFEHPKKENHGDYSTNAAIVIAKFLKKEPMKIAEILIERLKKEKTEKIFDKIEIINPGFINFFLSNIVLIEQLKKILEEKYGEIKIGRGRRVIIDYSSPNIAKPFGIGHLRSTIIGQALYNIYKFLGYKVIGDNHIGDWGTQYGKLIYQIKKENKDPKRLTINEMEKLYVNFHKEAKQTPKLEEEGRRWFKKLEEGDREATKIWKICVKKSLEEFERIYKILGVKIDYAFGESFYEPMLKKIIKEAKEKKIAKESQGALIIEYPKNELPPAIIQKSDGATTYLTRDLATIKFRLKKWNPDLIIYEVGADQMLHFKQLFKAVELLGWTKKTHFFHVAHGLYRTPTGKFSTRKGETVHLEEVLKEAIEKAKEIIEKSETGRGLSKKEKEKVSRMVGIGAVKYNDLSQHYSKDIIFDWNKILNLKGNSAPYLQYTFVRCKSLISKAGFSIQPKRLKLIELNLEEKNILRTIYKFPQVVKEAMEKFSPNLICNFVFDLAQKFNLFYDSHPIIHVKENSVKVFRLSLTLAVAKVLKRSLNLLGIDTPEKM